ncbi:hypothetical protein QTP86_008697 [Hemibagrus guttatus]|nr:hypothetical protein QTP86_008697 [Hemibagrus guttatus]
MIQGFSLGIDMYFSKEDSKQLKKGSEAKFAKQIRKISKHMQTCLDELMAFKTVINSEDIASLNPALGSAFSRRAGARGTTEVRVRTPHRAAAAAGCDRLTHQSEDPAGFSSYFLTRVRIAVRRLRTSGRPPASERAEQVVPRSRFPRMVPLSGVASTAGWPGPPLQDVVFREGRRLATGVEHASCPPEQLSGATEPLELGCRCGLQPPITSCVSPPL